MICLIILSSIWLGLNFFKEPILFAILGVILSLFIYKRFCKSYCLIFAIVFVVFSGLSFIRMTPWINQSFSLVIESKDNYFVILSGFNKFYISNYDNNFQIGDLIKINGSIEKINFSYLESGFNFNEYLNNKGIFYEIKNADIKTLFLNPIRLNDIKNSFLNNFSKNNQPFIESLIFATSNYDDYFLNMMSSMHLYRLMSTSGLIIYALLNGINKLLSLKINEKYSKIISLVILSLYLVFTLFKFSILRLTVLFIFRWINQYILKNKFSYISILSFSGIIFLIIDPYLAYQDSFILGYLISLIIYFTRNSFVYLKKWQLNLLIPFVVFLFFIPFEIQYYHEVNLFSFLIVNILSPFIILISVVTLLCFYKIPLYSASDFLIDGFKNTISFFNNFSINIHAGEMGLLLTIIYEFALIFLIYIFSIKFKPFYSFSLTFLLFLSIYFVPINNYISNEVTFLNVGQGDATYIRYKNNHILIDTGGSNYQDIAKECLIPFFKKKKIYYLDYVITTHNDIDHSGALNSLQENFNVKNYVYLEKDFPLNINGLILTNLNNLISESQDENDRSLVINFTIGDTDFLIMGDASKKIESDIIKKYPNLECDVLKIGHHGSKTSTSQQFIDFLRPKDAIISCGLDNNYGHPDSYVLSILNSYDVNIYRTDLQSSISYHFY